MRALPIFVSILVVAGSAAQAPFTEEAVTRGLNYFVVTPTGTTLFGRGVAFADLDNDGDPDVVAIGASDDKPGVFRNDGGVFTDVSATAGIPAMTWASGITAGDADGDGDLDLYFSNYLTPNVLMRNDGHVEFTDVTALAGVGDDGAGTGCAWADYDGDGRLDLYVSNRTGTALPGGGNSIVPNRLYRNLGGGFLNFADVAPALGVADDEMTFQAMFLDYDADGDPDIYLSTDKGLAGVRQNHLLENQIGGFVDVSAATNTGVIIDSMGLAIGDFSGDGRHDIYCANTTGGNPLLVSQNGGPFVDLSEVYEVRSNLVAWGTAFLDYDNDGALELYVCNIGPNRMYDSAGGPPCVDLAATLGIQGLEYSYGMALADVDGDGDLDMLVADDEQPLRLYINHEGELRNWVRFRVIGPANDRYGIGARIDLLADGAAQMREVVTGANYKSQNELVQHFGLDAAGIVNQIDVTWRSGETRTLSDYPAGATWTLSPTEHLGDGNLDQDWDSADYQAFVGCFTGDRLAVITPGCELFDMDGDGRVARGDIVGFLTHYAAVEADCDSNAVDDLRDIVNDAARDMNQDGKLDTCQALGDVDGNGCVTISDLGAVLAGFGFCGGQAGFDRRTDFDASNCTNISDLAIVLLNFGQCP
jgi:hypothetical protein